MADDNTPDYDDTLAKFADYREHNVRKPVEHYTIHSCMLKQLLDKDDFLTGKRVLDLACGHGYYTRQLKELHCAYILGVDESPTMIELARSSKYQNLEGIEYMVSDAKSMSPPEVPFDLVTAFYLFDYAQTKDEFVQMVRVVYEQLGEGKTFIGIIGNVVAGKTMFDNRKYGITRHIEVPLDSDTLADGTEIIVTLYDNDDKLLCNFPNYYYSPATYEKVFQEVGFKSLQWVPYQIDPNDQHKDFYKDLIACAPSIGIIAAK